MFRTAVVALALAIGQAAPAAAEAIDVVSAVNAARLRDCAGASRAATPLSTAAALQDAARFLAGGERLEPAVAKSGYHARQSATIHIPEADDAGAVRALLARRFCRIVGDPGMAEIGFFQRDADLWIVLAQPFAPPAPDDAAVARRVFELINAARTEARRCGRKKFAATTPLRYADALGRAAEAHARDMATADFLDHEGSDGSAPADRASRAGYAWKLVAENVAAGQASPEEVVATWLDSPGHCANLMDAAYKDTGIGYVVNLDGKRGTYWVQMFGTSR